MRRFTLVLVAGALFVGGAAADANKGQGGGTPPSATVCTPAVTDANRATYTGSCSATNPGGRTCTQEYVGGQPTNYSCTKS